MKPSPNKPERAVGRAPSVPKDASGFAVVSLFVSLAVVLACWGVLLAVRSALQAANHGSALADMLLFALALLPLWLFRPALLGVAHARESLKALAQDDLVKTRVHNAAARSWSAFALGYAGAVLLVAVFVLFIVLNDVAVGKTFFRLDLIYNSFGLVFRAFLTNVFIFCVAEVLILVWALVVAIARLAPGKAGQPIRFLATAYTDIFRGLPSIITIYLVGFGLPLTGLVDGPMNYIRERYGINDLSPVFAIFALTLTYGAYVAEVYRAGIESIHPSQVAAARSLGLSFGQTLRFVVVPQAVRRIIPPLLNDFIGLQKDTALVNVIGTIDAFNQAKIIASNKFNLSAVTTVAILFVLITIPQARLVDHLLARDQQRMRTG